MCVVVVFLPAAFAWALGRADDRKDKGGWRKDKAYFGDGGAAGPGWVVGDL